MTHLERGGQLVERDDRGIAAAALEAADVLLTEPGNLSELLLSQTVLLPDPLNVPPHQLAHVHAPRSADYTL